METNSPFVGSHPFDAPGRTDAQMRKAIQQGRVEFPSPQWDGGSEESVQLALTHSLHSSGLACLGVSDEAIDLIERLLQAGLTCQTGHVPMWTLGGGGGGGTDQP